MQYGKWILLGVLSAFGPNTGCMTNCVDLRRDGHVCTHCTGSKHIHFKNLCVWREDNETVVHGTVKRCTTCKQRIYGCVLVQVVDESGESIFDAKTELIPLHQSRHASGQSRFSTRIPFVLPTGSRINIEYIGCTGNESLACSSGPA